MNTTSDNKLTRVSLKKSRDLYKTLVSTATLLIVIIGIKIIARDIVAPIFLAVFLSILLYPLFKTFRKEGRASWITLVLTIGTIVLFFSGVILIVSISFSQLSGNLDFYLTKINTQIAYLFNFTFLEDDINHLLRNVATVDNIRRLIAPILSSLGSLFTVLIFVPLSSILILLQVDSFTKSPLGKREVQNENLEKLSRFSKSITIYIVGRAKVNLFTGTLFFIILFVMDIEFALLWGLLMVLLSFIPYIGSATASLPAILLALVQYGWAGAGIVTGSILIINFFSENVLDPYIQSKGNKLSALVIIMSLIFWVWLFGPIGAILSVPLTVLLKIILEDFDETRWISTLMEGNYGRTSQEIEKSKSINGLWNRVFGRG